jgi:hypothetical protein
LANLPKPAKSPKRQILGAIAIGMATSAMAASAYNTIEISHLNANFKLLQNKHNMLVDITDLHEKHLHNIDVKIADIAGYWSDYFLNNPTLISTRIQEVLTEAQRIFDKLTHGFTQAINERLPTDFLSYNVTSTILHYISEQNHLKNFMAPVTSVADLFHLDTSYLYDNLNHEFIIFLHVPVTRNTEIMELHKYHAFPLAERTADLQNVIPVVGDENIIAIGKNKQYIPMTESELQHCTIVHNIYLCKGRRVIQHDYTTTCIGAMYNQENEFIKKWCTFKIEEPRETAKQLNHDQWLVNSPSDFTTRLECEENKPNEDLKTNAVRIFKDKATTVTVPVGCKLPLQKQTINGPEMDLGPRKGITTYEWTFDENIIDLQIPEFKLNKTEARLMEIINNTPAPLDLSSLKVKDEDLFHPHASWLGLAGLGLGVVLIVGILIYICKKKCCKSGTTQATAPPSTLAVYNIQPPHNTPIRINPSSSALPAKAVY